VTELAPSPINERDDENFGQIVRKKRKMKIPSPNEKGAPRFDPAKAVELARFFDQVDEIIAENSIEDTDKKKNLLGRYAPATTEMEWKAFVTYKKGSYEEYKKEIMESYPEAAELEIGSLARMNAVTRPYIIDPVSTYDLSRLLALKRGFCAESAKLIRPPTLLSNRELVSKFTNCLEASYVRNIIIRLGLIQATRPKPATVVGPDAQTAEVTERRVEDRFDLKEVIDMAVEIAKEMQNSFGVRTGSEPTAIIPEVKNEDEERSALWKDSMEVKFKNIESSLDTTLRKVNELSVLAQQQAQRPPPAIIQRSIPYNPLNQGQREPYVRAGNPNPGTSWNSFQPNCFYCRMPGHLLRTCPEVERHLKLKWVVRTENSVQFADGTPIRGDSATSMKDAVDRLNQSKTILTKSSSAVSQNYLEQGGYMSQYSYGTDPEHELVRRIDELSQLHGREALEKVLANSSVGIPLNYDESDPSNQNF
jgi:hypothetical protein